MEFGRVEPEAIKDIDFLLPPDGRMTRNSLKGIPSAKPCRFSVGMAKWGRKQWAGPFYPPGTKQRDFLESYARRLDSIELNATFFSFPGPEEIGRWKQQVEASENRNFLFFPKVSRTISHIKRLQDCDLLTRMYLDAVAGLGKFEGPSLLQLGGSFGPKDFQHLASFLESWPAEKRLFAEVRHQDWFSQEQIRIKLFDLLAKLNIGSAMTDSSGRRDCLHMELPTPDLFVRFVGNGGGHERSDFARVDNWVERISEWMDRGLETVNFFCHHHDEQDTYALAAYVTEQFNKRLGAGLREITYS